MSTIIDTVYFEDDYWINDRVELLKLVWLDYWLTVVKSMRDAYDTALSDNWFNFLLKDSGLFNIFQTFPTDDIDVIKVLINYDNNPSFNNFSRVIDLLFPEGAVILITTQLITIDIDADNFRRLLHVVNPMAGIDGNLRVVNPMAGIDGNLNVLYDIDFILASQSFYILRHFIPVGTQLTINLVTDMDYAIMTGTDGTSSIIIQGDDGYNIELTQIKGKVQ